MADLQTFLFQHSVKKGSNIPITHTRIGDNELNIYGGSYHIPKNDLDMFYELYYDYVFVKQKNEYLTEKQNGNAMVVDIDFRYSYDTTEKQYTKQTIEDIIVLYGEVIKKVLNVEENIPFNVFVFEKQNVNRLADKQITKDGIHIMFGLKVDFIVQQEIRKEIIKEISDIIEIPLINTWEDVFDEGISNGPTNWQLYGSKKPNHEAYQLTEHYIFHLENDNMIIQKQNIADFNIKDNFKMLSVQYDNNYPEFSLKIEIPITPSPCSITQITNSNTKKTVHQKLEAIKKTEENDKLEKLIYFAKNGFDNCCKKHEDIYKIGFALANVFQEDGKDLFLFFAEQYTSIDWEINGKTEYEEKYTYYLKNNRNTLNLGTIYWIFKKFDKELYNIVNKEWNLNHYKIDLIYNQFTGAFADYFKNIYGDFICSSNGFVYMYNGIRWKKCNEKNTELICFVDKVFHKDLIEYGNNKMKLTTELLKDTTDETDVKMINQKIDDIRKYLKNVSGTLRNSAIRNSYINDIIAFSTDDNIKFDTNCFLFAFENKIFDLEHNCFIEPSPEQYISKNCGYAYDDSYDIKNKTDLETLLISIFPNKDIRDYYLTYLATGLSGIHMEEFMIATGVGGNGKSLINGLMMSCIGEYGYVIPSIVLTKEIKDGPNPELAKLDGVRFALMSEPDAKRKFCCSTIKSITGDDTLPVRLLNSNKVGIDLLCTAVCEGNDIPDFDEVNQAMNRRVRATIFEAIAIEKEDYDKLSIEERYGYCVKNPYYKEKEFKEKYRQALFMILTNYFQEFMLNNKTLKAMPSKCKTKVINLFATSDNIYSWFEEIYEPDDLTTCKPIPIKDVYANFSNSSYFMKLPKQEQRKFNKKNFTEKITTNLFLQKSLKFRDTYWKKEQQKTDYLVGWKLKPLEHLDDNKLDA